ncbi:MAG: queuosine precursor transporter [Candidatus Nanohaloarchaea archaeon]
MIANILLWILLTLTGATTTVLLAEKYGYELIIGVFSGLIVTAQVLANKTVTILEFTVPAGVLVYSTSYLLTDVLAEFHGKEEAKKAVWSGFMASILLVLSINIAITWPSAAFWKAQEAFVTTLGTTWRIVAASLAAYVVSMNTDVYIFHKIKEYTGDSKLYLRNMVSTGVAQFIDTVIFIMIAFYGVMPVIPLIIGQYIIKLAIAALDTPYIYLVKWAKKQSWFKSSTLKPDFLNRITGGEA